MDKLEIKQDNNSKHNSEIKKQVILLIITADETSRYLVVTKLSNKPDKHETSCKDNAYQFIISTEETIIL